MPADAVATLNDRLQSRLHFAVEDLKANREQRLSADQRMRVQSKQRQYVRNGTLALVIMWAIFTALMIGSVFAEGAKPEDLHVLPYVLAGVTLLFALVGVGSRIYARDLINGKISSVDGQATTRRAKYMTRYGSGISYELRIGRRKFLMTSETELDAFKTGASYRVYYIRYAPVHLIMSAEALGAPHP